MSANRGDYASLEELIADVLVAENVRLVGSAHGRWDEAAPAVVEAIVSKLDLVADRVLSLIDTELRRLDRRGDLLPCGRFNLPQRRWQEGVYVARESAAGPLREIRAAYVADLLTREALAMGLYDDPTNNSSARALSREDTE